MILMKQIDNKLVYNLVNERLFRAHPLLSQFCPPFLPPHRFPIDYIVIQ